jgi:hypothetical protein
MVEFMETHLMDCDVCLTDPDVQHEVKKITEIVLPASKMTKQPKPAETEKVFRPPSDTVEPDEEGDDVDNGEPVVPDVDDNVNASPFLCRTSQKTCSARKLFCEVRCFFYYCPNNPLNVSSSF